jgi:acyl-CoA thioesterase-1
MGFAISWFGCVAIVFLAGCAATETPNASAGAAASAGPAADIGEVETATSTRLDRPRIVALGDSLTAGLGLSQDQAYPRLLQDRLDATGLNFEVVNAGVSGDTSAGGLSRLDWALEGDVRILIVALGGNDGLRGLPPEELGRNLATIIEIAQDRGVRVILAGMEAPPNFGAAYTAGFRSVYVDLAERFDVRLIPFLLEGVAGDPDLNQSDGIHPTEAGATVIADTLWAVLRPLAEESAKVIVEPRASPGS